jgi:AraC-like DNA-binding protein
VKDVARKFSIDPEVLRRQFVRSEGISLSSFMNRIKIVGAAILASETTLPMKEIIGLTGLGSRETATRLFKQQFGMTFGEFRRRAQSRAIRRNVRQNGNET